MRGRSGEQLTKWEEQDLASGQAVYSPEELAIFDAIPTLVWVSDQQGRCIYTNSSWNDFTGLTYEEGMGYNWQQCVHPDDLDSLMECFGKALGAHIPIQMEYRLRSNTGEYRWVLNKANPRFDESANLKGYIGLCIDISERKLMEEELRQNHELLKETQELARLGSFRWNLKDDSFTWTSELANVMGCDPKLHQPSFSRFLQCVHPDDRAMVDRLVTSVIENKLPYVSEHRILLPDNSVRHIYAEYKTDLVEDDKTVVLMGVVQEVTERVMAERKIRQSQERLDLVLKGANLGLWDWNIATGEVFINERWAEMLGYEENELQPHIQTIHELIHPEDVSKGWQSVLGDVNHEPAFYEAEIRMRTREGDWRWILSRGRVVERDKQGHPLRAAGTHLDITDKKAAEVQLLKNQELLAYAQALSHLGSFEWDIKTGVINWTAEMYRIFGVDINTFHPSPDTVRGYTHPDDRERIAAKVSAALKLNKPFVVEFRIVRPDGETRIVQTDGKLKEDTPKDSPVLVGNTQDVTERKLAEKALKKSEERYRSLIENSYDVITLLDKDGIIRYQSPSVENVFGYQQEELTGKGLIDYLHPNDTTEARKLLQDWVATPGRLPVIEWRFLHKDGSWRQIEISAKNLINDPAIGAIVANCRDVTERNADREKIYQLSRELEQRVVERTAELNAANQELRAFNYSVSHDLRTPLRAAEMFAYLLQENFSRKLPSEAKEYINSLRQCVREMEQMISDLLEFSQMGRKEKKPDTFDMAVLVKEIYHGLLRDEPGRDVTFIMGDLPPAFADQAMIRRVMMNLVSNALKFTRKTEKPRVEVQGYVKENEVVYSVKDNGVGFDMKYARDIFGVFERLHPADEFPGTGAGLAIVERIIQRHGGRVWTEAEVNKGAAFYFSLPRQE